MPRRDDDDPLRAVALVIVVGVLGSRTLTLPVPAGPFAVGRAVVTVPPVAASAEQVSTVARDVAEDDEPPRRRGVGLGQELDPGKASRSA